MKRTYYVFGEDNVCAWYAEFDRLWKAQALRKELEERSLRHYFYPPFIIDATDLTCTTS